VWAAILSAIAPHPDAHVGQVRVLIVDDSAEMAGLLRMWLEDEGCAVITAASGREAIDAAAVYYPDVVFLDVVMPGLDGFHVCEALRQLRPAPEVILMTGYSNPDSARRGADLGVVTLLEKPLTREAVLEAFKAAVERCRRDPLNGLRSHFGIPRRP
jgi:CheY-like chemotaxis protein